MTTSAPVSHVDPDRRFAEVTVTLPVAPLRVFQALTSPAEIVEWWGSAETYRVTAWTGELRVGGAWRSDGRGADGVVFSTGGKFVELDPPRKIVQTCRADWGLDTLLTFSLKQSDDGTLLSVRHEGFDDHPESCAAHALGWQAVLAWLRAYLIRTSSNSEEPIFASTYPHAIDFKERS